MPKYSKLVDHFVPVRHPPDVAKQLSFHLEDQIESSFQVSNRIVLVHNPESLIVKKLDPSIFAKYHNDASILHVEISYHII